MKFYLIEITTYEDSTPLAKGIYEYNTKNEAVANFHTKLGGAMKNANYASEQLIVVGDNNEIIESALYVKEAEDEIQD